MKKTFAVAIAALAIAGCSSPTITLHPVPPPTGLSTATTAPAAAASSNWVVLGTTITGDSFNSAQALASALNCPVVTAPAGATIPSNATGGLFCDINPGDPVMVAMFANSADLQQEAGNYISSDACMDVGPGWVVLDTQVNGTPPCDQAIAKIGGSRADLLP